ncbi:MAG: hypothetical protein QW701_02375 [Candidatus Nezhaarchaeales archaeon]
MIDLRAVKLKVKLRSFEGYEEREMLLFDIEAKAEELFRTKSTELHNKRED